MTNEEGRSAPDLLTQDSDGVSWENQSDRTVRTVQFELSGAAREMRFAHGHYSERMWFQPYRVEVRFINGARRSVTVSGPRVLKNGGLGLRHADSYYLTTKDDQHMPEWLKQLVAEVSS